MWSGKARGLDCGRSSETRSAYRHPDAWIWEPGIPEPDEIRGLIVMGGPMGVYETDKYPFLAGECSLIADNWFGGNVQC